MKRILLFLATNLAIVMVLSITMRVLGVEPYLNANGLNLGALLIDLLILAVGFILVIVILGFTGFSLFDLDESKLQKASDATKHALMAVVVDRELGAGPTLGLDWFLLNLFLLALLFAPLERLFPQHAGQSAFRVGWTTDGVHFFASHVFVQALSSSTRTSGSGSAPSSTCS